MITFRGIYFYLPKSLYNFETFSKLCLLFYPLKLSKLINYCFGCYFLIVLNWTLQLFYEYYFSSYSSVILIFSYFLSTFSLFCTYLLFSPTNLFCWRIFRFNWFLIRSVLLVYICFCFKFLVIVIFFMAFIFWVWYFDYLSAESELNFDSKSSTDSAFWLRFTKTGG